MQKITLIPADHLIIVIYEHSVDVFPLLLFSTFNSAHFYHFKLFVGPRILDFYSFLSSKILLKLVCIVSILSSE